MAGSTQPSPSCLRGKKGKGVHHGGGAIEEFGGVADGAALRQECAREAGGRRQNMDGDRVGNGAGICLESELGLGVTTSLGALVV